MEKDFEILTHRDDNKRPPTSLSATSFTDNDSPFQIRRDPSGVSEVAGSCNQGIETLMAERELIEEQIRSKKTEQKRIQKQIDELRSPNRSLVRSKTCAIQ